MLKWWTNKELTVDATRHGFDNPLASASMDLLGRHTITQQLYSHLTNLEPEWSVRVGLLAPWGEGKTTICKWIVERAKADGHIPVLYSPWSAKTDSELWLGLYIAVMEALAANNIKLERNLLESGKHMLSKLSQKAWLKQVSELHSISKIGLGVLHTALIINQQDMKEIAKTLQGKRIIVIIDDLDRVEFTLIPRLLMSLRDLMDIDNFSFLLPFDEKIVAEALAEQNKSESYGDNFLEKILDHRVHISPATRAQVAVLFNNELQKYCHFIRSSCFDGIYKYLPKNPRKLKSLVRGLRVFEAESKRHRDGELDWKALLFAQMIKIESETFFRLFVRDTFFRQNSDTSSDSYSLNPWTTAAFEQNESKAKSSELSRIDNLLNESHVDQMEKRERLICLCEGWRSSYGWNGQHYVKYALKLLDKPETITWGEFDVIWKLWTNKKCLNDLIPWINEHAETVHKPKAEIVTELIVTLTQRYNEHLELASSAALYSEQEQAVNEAKEVLTLIDNLIQNSIEGITQAELLTINAFSNVFDVMRRWIEFQGNESDKRLRAEERVFLRGWVMKASDVGLSLEYAHLFKKLKKSCSFSDPKTRLESVVFDELLVNTNETLDNTALEMLQLPNEIAQIMPYDAGAGIKDLLVNVKSSIWESTNPSSALDILSKAGSNPIIQKNALDFLGLLYKCSIEGTTELKPEEVVEFYKNHQLISVIWNAAIATPLQFRRLKETRETREHLISKGVKESLLAKPAWLMVIVEDS